MAEDRIRTTNADPTGTGQPPLTERQRLILRLIVREYVATGRPVGSRTLVDNSGIGVSPATIRNEMAALEERGYLEHLHTSGGRIPTDRGYRYFVAHLMGDIELPSSEQLTILHQFRQVELQLEQWIELAAATLARAAGNVSVVSAPIPQSPRLRHLELVALQPRLGLIILVTTDGAVRQVMAHWPEDAGQETLSPLADTLAATLRGYTPEEIETHAVGATGLARATLDQIASALRGLTAGGAPVRHSGSSTCWRNRSSAARPRHRNCWRCWVAGRSSAPCCRGWKRVLECRSSSARRTRPMSCAGSESSSRRMASTARSLASWAWWGRLAWPTIARSPRCATWPAS
jgi:hypothetical protein